LFSILLYTQPSFGQKKKKKNGSSFILKQYHDLTSRYNGYFNSRLKLKTIEQTTEKEIKDNYDTLLSIFPAQDKIDANSNANELDLIIEKCTKVIQKHPDSKWVDDCFYLMGKAHLYKEEHTKSIKCFLHISSSYKPGKGKKPKKKKKSRRHYTRIKNQKEKNSLDDLLNKYKIRHQPIYYQAIIALIQTYIDQKEFSKAQTVSDLIKNDPNFPEDLKKDLLLTKAHSFVKNEQFDKAIEPLHDAVLLTKKKKDKPRLLFIEAQLHSLNENYDNAIKRYKQILSLNPEHILAFNARLNMARLFIDADMPTSKIKQMLFSMIKDEKNLEYLDILYYVLAEIEQEDFNSIRALDYLKKSVRLSLTNSKQKGLSFLKSADIYFMMESYRPAALFYDSALQFLTSVHIDVEQIKNKTKTLKKLIVELDIIAYEDSMQYLASLPKKELEDLIDELIDEKLSLLEKEKEEKDLEENPSELTSINSNLINNKFKSNEWYFYNPQAKAYGFKEFTNKWGNIKLEDNWRRSNKISSFGSAEDISENEAYSNEELAILERSQYMLDIPISNASKDSSDSKLSKALFNAGKIYFNELNNFPLALESFQKLLKKVPKNRFLPETYFQLYYIYKRQSNWKSAEYYKRLLYKKFPDHLLTKKLKKSNLNQNKIQDKKLNEHYNASFNDFYNKSYSSVIKRAEEAKVLFPDNPFSAKYLYLHAVSLGKLDSTLKMILLLESIVKNYKENDVSVKAQKLLDLISRDPDIIKSKNNASFFFYNNKEEHFFIALVKEDIFKSSNISAEIANFNDVEYKRNTFSVSNLQFNEELMLVIVKNFKSMKESENYFSKIISNKKMSLNNVNAMKFIIGKNNFTKLLNEKKPEGYEVFFTKYYLKKDIKSDKG